MLPARRHLLALSVVLAACTPTAPPVEPAAAPRDATTVVKLNGGDDAFNPEDRDGDGIPDAYDLCPGLPEDGKGPHPWDGCPADRDPAKRVTPMGPSPKQSLKVTRGEIKLTEEVRFRSGSATIDPSSQDLLRSIAQILKDVPEIELVEIAGHADDSGVDDRNKKLTQQRAGSVLTDLVGKGIARTRLRSAGYSAYCAIDPGKDDAARAKNRRVEFRILRRDGRNLEPGWGGCAEAEKHGMKPVPLPAPAAPKAPKDDRTAARECSEDQARQCTRSCEKGDVAACEALANLFAADEPRKAFSAASRACDLGALQFCPRVAGYLRAGTGVTKNPAKAHELLLKACAKGNGRSCTDAGEGYQQGNGVKKDEAKAAELFLRGCESGDSHGCELLGQGFWSGQGLPKDRRRGFDLTIAACELGSAVACAAIGTAYKEDPGATARSRGRALAALHVACEQDESAPACEAVKAMEEQPGEHQALPVCSAGDFKACRAACSAQKAGAGCVDFAVAMLYGTGVRRRSADALALFTDACREGNAKACTMSAVVHAGHNEDPKAERAAASDFEAACQLGEASGCVNHALLELEGLGTYRDEEEATKDLAAACGKGVGVACAHLSAAVGKGTGAPRDAGRARSLQEKACSLGFRPACP